MWHVRNFFSPAVISVIFFFFFLAEKCSEPSYEQVLQSLSCTISLFNVTLNYQPQAQCRICWDICSAKEQSQKNQISLKIVLTVIPLTHISASKTTPEKETAPP